jgi:hypothetical protein
MMQWRTKIFCFVQCTAYQIPRAFLGKSGGAIWKAEKLGSNNRWEQ